MSGPLMVLVGTILIGAGGAMATYGWGVISRDAEKKARVGQLARALAAECVFNRNVLVDPLITLSGNTDPTVRTKFPRLRMVAIHAALSSGTFLEDTGTGSTYLLLTNTAETIEQFNRILDYFETQLMTQRLSSEEIRSIRTALADSKSLKSTLTDVQGLGDHVYERYLLPKNRDWAKK